MNIFIVSDNFHELQWKERSPREWKKCPNPEFEKIPLTVLILPWIKFPFLENSQF